MQENIDYKEEYKKCAKDFTYFCEKYVYIRATLEGKVKFNLYEYQKRVLKDFENNRFNIILKFRQGGLTTISVIWASWKAMFHLKENQILVVSISDREAKKAGKIVDFMVENLPNWLKPRMPPKLNAHEKIFLDTGGEIDFYTVKSARSRSLSLLIIDEAAHIKNMYEHWASLFPTLSGGGKCIVVSTPNGMGDWYSEEFHKALKGENKFNVIDVDVSEHPIYSNKQWLEDTRVQLGEELFAQEVLKQFLNPGKTFLNPRLISDLDLQTRETPPISKRFPQWDTSKDSNKGALWIWKGPVEGKEYIVAADSGEGIISGDNSAFQVIDVADAEQVAEFYSGSIPPHTFAQVLHQIATSYNFALLVVEKNGPGLATMEILERSLFYPALYGRNTRKVKNKMGFITDCKTRPIVCDTLKSALLNKTIKINSIRLAKEFSTFIFNATKKRPEAPKGCHDDLIFALGIALKVKNDMYASMHSYVPSEEQPKDFNAHIGDFEQIKKELEELFQNKIDDSALRIPYIMENDILAKDDLAKANFQKRPFNSLLKEFNW